jgi:hypothetical protein
VNWMHQPEDRDQWLVFLDTTMDFRVPKMDGWLRAGLATSTARLLHGGI